MSDLVYDRYFEVLNPGACITKIAVYVNRGIIVRCDIAGCCSGNLKMLAINLEGVALKDSCKCFENVCNGWNKSCVKILKRELSKQFTNFMEQYQ